jgi:translation elongation factor EF-Tu-like GTPase
MTEEEHFKLIVDDIYYIGGIGHVVCGTIQSGSIDIGKENVVRLERTNAWFLSKPKMMFCSDVGTIEKTGDNIGMALKMNRNDVVAGDVITTDPGDAAKPPAVKIVKGFFGTTSILESEKCSKISK